MPTRAFYNNLGTILIYAVVGTLINAVLIGLTLWGLAKWEIFNHMPSLTESMLFASAISAVVSSLFSLHSFFALIKRTTIQKRNGSVPNPLPLFASFRNV